MKNCNITTFQECINWADNHMRNPDMLILEAPPEYDYGAYLRNLMYVDNKRIEWHDGAIAWKSLAIDADMYATNNGNTLRNLHRFNQYIDDHFEEYFRDAYANEELDQIVLIVAKELARRLGIVYN